MRAYRFTDKLRIFIRKGKAGTQVKSAPVPKNLLKLKFCDKIEIVKTTI